MTYDPSGIDDDDPRAVVIQSMMGDLGFCLNSYGQIEYLAGDLLWHAWRLPEYQHLARRVPMKLNQRIEELDKVTSSEGPLKAHASDLELIWERLKALSGSRHMFVHGHCALLVTRKGDCAMEFRQFLPNGEKRSRQVSPEALATARHQWCLFASSAQRIIGAIYVGLGLENPGAMPRKLGPESAGSGA